MQCETFFREFSTKKQTKCATFNSSPMENIGNNEKGQRIGVLKISFAIKKNSQLLCDVIFILFHVFILGLMMAYKVAYFLCCRVQFMSSRFMLSSVVNLN